MKVRSANKSFLQCCKLLVTVLIIYTAFFLCNVFMCILTFCLEWCLKFSLNLKLWKVFSCLSFSFCLCLCSWSAKLYLTPSNIVLLTAIALIGVCVFILVIIGILHWQEKVRTNISAFYIQPFTHLICTSLTPVFPVSSMDLFETLQHPCFLLVQNDCDLKAQAHPLVFGLHMRVKIWADGCVCVWPCPQALWGCSTHTAMLLIALFCPFSISNLFLIIPNTMSSWVLCVSLCTWKLEFLSSCVGRWLFAFLYAICTSECVNSFLLNTQNWSVA